MAPLALAAVRAAAANRTWSDCDILWHSTEPIEEFMYDVSLQHPADDQGSDPWTPAFHFHKAFAYSKDPFQS
jgi:hypothetical protein